ncbi:unnamed protein product [Rotaria socialis]|uniref:G-protein coupled receptors family 1 profile domain-containing protein n=1 Tax=Rotaria socialis TaxID=392032 RepID=A0A820LR94_9BILA|nr:unnamed protein product [Rotaria socialis]CAF3330471.1 unnamed protein product [Rotaria socialis]CAF3435756.1 unnamed protein product [Rotaria socialis]CAF4233216.1 unnamed protein product [Rotaria socialis]CAF4349980.1 unnamed protein product [Rotaria socialis]
MEGLHITAAVLGVLIYTAGFIGNFLSLFIFMQKEVRKVSTGLIFLLLAIFSTIHLFSLIVEFIATISGFVLVRNSIFRCQFILWLQNVTRSICSFLAVTVSLDRFLRSEYPIKSRIWCTTMNVAKLCVIYCLFYMLLYAIFFDPRNVMDSNDQCSFPYDDTFRLIILTIMPSVRFVLICIIPVILMGIFGGRMLYNIKRVKKRIAQQKMVRNAAIATIAIPESTRNVKHTGNQNRAKTLDRMLLLMVFTNIISYIITQTPFNIYTVYYGSEASDSYKAYALMRAFLLLWSSIYFGIGFYAYFITATQFRKQFFSNMKYIFTFNQPLQHQSNT